MNYDQFRIFIDHKIADSANPASVIPTLITDLGANETIKETLYAEHQSTTSLLLLASVLAEMRGSNNLAISFFLESTQAVHRKILGWSSDVKAPDRNTVSEFGYYLGLISRHDDDMGSFSLFRLDKYWRMYAWIPADYWQASPPDQDMTGQINVFTALSRMIFSGEKPFTETISRVD